MIQFQRRHYKLQNNRHAKTQTREKFLRFKQIVASKTRGKFILLNQNEYSKYLNRHVQNKTTLGSQQINDSSDISKCRKLLNNILEPYIDNHIKKQIILMASEAATNIIKHAYRGNLTLVKSNGYLRLIFSDEGPGILYEDLPLILFCWGTSLDDSLGAGIILIYHYADRILLYTTNKGTTLIIEKSEG